MTRSCVRNPWTADGSGWAGRTCARRSSVWAEQERQEGSAGRILDITALGSAPTAPWAGRGGVSPNRLGEVHVLPAKCQNQAADASNLRAGGGDDQDPRQSERVNDEVLRSSVDFFPCVIAPRPALLGRFH